MDYSQYQDDPVRFGSEVLGESYTDDVRRVMESVRDNKITVVRSANGTGKSHVGGALALWFYLSFPGAQVYTAAAPPESNLKKILWGEIGERIDHNPDLFKNQRVTVMHVEAGPKSFLTGVTIPTSGDEKTREAKFSGKHAPNLMFMFDEGDAIPDEVYTGTESCISGGFARWVIFFNPRHKSGAPYRFERDGTANVVHLSAFNHDNVRTGKDVIPGAVTRDKTVERINLWARPLASGEKPDHECFKLPSFLDGVTAPDSKGGEFPPLKPGHYKVINPAFWYMVLGKYPTQAVNQLISEEWISRARSRYDLYVAEYGETPPVGSVGIAGLDVGELGTDPSCLCFRYGGFVPPLVDWQGVDTDITAKRTQEFVALNDGVKSVNVDADGVGAGIAPVLRRRYKIDSYRIMVTNKPTYETELGRFYQLRDQLWWSCREWLREDPGAMLPPDEDLREELIAALYLEHNGRVKILDKDTMRESLGRSPNRADALCLTFAPQERAFSPLSVEKCLV